MPEKSIAVREFQPKTNQMNVYNYRSAHGGIEEHLKKSDANCQSKNSAGHKSSHVIN